MQEWVHTSPVILTDAVYLTYITGPTGDAPIYTGTAAQRNAAYLAAEQSMIREIGAPLLPTSITGTFIWPSLRGMDSYTIGESTMVLPFKWIRSIESVTVLYGGGTGTCGLQETDGCHRIRDGIGYLDVFCVGNLVRQQCSSVSAPYQVRIAYTAGLPTGTAADDTSLHMALSMVAEQFLNEIVDPGANPGGPGAPGVKTFSTMGYSETPLEASLYMTSFGASARMNMAKRLIRHLKKKRALRF